MKADINLLYSSPLCKIFDFKCLEHQGTVCKPEWADGFYISFTRKGNFGYRVAKDFFDIHSSVVLLENARTEYTISHDHHIKDECTAFQIDETLLTDMALTHAIGSNGTRLMHSNKGFAFPATTIRSTPQLDYLHRIIYHNMMDDSNRQPLKIDLLVISLLQQVLSYFTQTKQNGPHLQVDKVIKDRHLETIDRGKSYILDNFQKEMNLSDIARHAFVSPFHFSRLFKHFTSCSPYQYLLQVRLNHAVRLLQDTSYTVTEICYESGFNSLEHFIATFTRRYGSSPLKYRNRLSI